MFINNNIDDNQQKSTQRQLDPENVQLIWSAIIDLSVKKLDETNNEHGCDYRKVLINENELKQHLCDENDDLNQKSISKFLEQAINDGLICKQSLKSTNSNEANNDEPPTQMNGNLNDDHDEILISLPQKIIKPTTHDWYCFECHRVNYQDDDDDDDDRSNNDDTNAESVILASHLLKCLQCWRIYHQECVQKSLEFINEIIPENDRIIHEVNDDDNNNDFITKCPICLLSSKYQTYMIGSRKFDQIEFNQILSYTYARFKAKSIQHLQHSMKNLKEKPSTLFSSKLSSSSSTINQESTIVNGESNENSESNIDNNEIILSPKDLLRQLAINYLIYKKIELIDIENLIENNKYETIGTFLGDCLTIRHILQMILISLRSQQSQTMQKRQNESLMKMIDIAKYELKEMIGCIDCYRNSNRQNNKLWFCEPCSPPHQLVFAKQKGYPYWPAKVIYPRTIEEINRCDQLDVRFFGSNHERSIIDKSNIKDINSSLSELNILKPISSLDKALQELRTYRELLESLLPPESTHDNSIKIHNNDKCNNNHNNTDKQKQRTSKRLSRKVNSRYSRKINDTSQDDDNEDSENLMTEESNDIDGDDDDENSQTASSKRKLNSDEDDDENDVTDEQENNDDDTMSTTLNSETDESVRHSKTSNEKQMKKQVNNEKNKNTWKKIKSKNKKLKKSTSTTDSMISNLNNRVRRKKVIYSPNYYYNKNSNPSNNSTSRLMNEQRLLEKRKYNRRLFTNNNTHEPPSSHSPVKRINNKLLKSSNCKFHDEKSAAAQSQIKTKRKYVRRNSLPSAIACSASNSPLKNNLSSINKKLKMQTSSLNDNQLKESASSTMSKYLRKQLEIERERQIIKEQRKSTSSLKNEIVVPKPIPPMVAIKSNPSPLKVNQQQSLTTPIKSLSNDQTTPLFNSPSILNQILSNSNPKKYLNGDYMNRDCGNNVKTEMDNNIDHNKLNEIKLEIENNSNQDNQLLETTVEQNNCDSNEAEIHMKEQSNQEKDITINSLNEEIETSDSDNKNIDNDAAKNSIEEDKMEIEGDKNVKDENIIEQQSITLNNSNNIVNIDDDDDDEEPYLYDDEELEDEINCYLEYEREKNEHKLLLQQRLQQFQLFQQQQQQQFMQSLYHPTFDNQLNKTTNGFIVNNKTKNGDELSPFLEPKKKYIDFSQSSHVYVPTRKNQNLINSYLYHIENENSNDNAKLNTNFTTYNDYLAQYIINKDEFDMNNNNDHDDQLKSPTSKSGKKRGRPLKNQEHQLSSFEHSQKARCLLEKSYLQETACNRGCLTNNVKAFKKFREFLEAQNRNDTSKLKKELDESNEQISRLNARVNELETMVKNERELNKRLNPEILTKMEDRFKCEISKIKRKQWCSLCEAEANYFCCFKTNYCSPECQLKHWQSGHQFECSRNKNVMTTN